MHSAGSSPRAVSSAAQYAQRPHCEKPITKLRPTDELLIVNAQSLPPRSTAIPDSELQIGSLTAITDPHTRTRLGDERSVVVPPSLEFESTRALRQR